MLIWARYSNSSSSSSSIKRPSTSKAKEDEWKKNKNKSLTNRGKDEKIAKKIENYERAREHIVCVCVCALHDKRMNAFHLDWNLLSVFSGWFAPLLCLNQCKSSTYGCVSICLHIVHIIWSYRRCQCRCKIKNGCRCCCRRRFFHLNKLKSSSSSPILTIFFFHSLVLCVHVSHVLIWGQYSFRLDCYATI